MIYPISYNDNEIEDNGKYELIIQRIKSFPALPQTVANVLEVTNNPESSGSDLVQVILPDPAMCLTILKIANSALYGQSRKVSSLERAVMVLGFDEILSIVLSQAVVSSFQKVMRNNKSVAEKFWDHSFSCALAAKSIAEYLNFPSGQFFMGGPHKTHKRGQNKIIKGVRIKLNLHI